MNASKHLQNLALILTLNKKKTKKQSTSYSTPILTKTMKTKQISTFTPTKLSTFY